MSNIVLDTKTYVGNGIANAIASYFDRSGGIAASFAKLTGSVRNDTKSRIQWKLSVPTVATEASSCACPGQVLRVADVDISVRFDPGATQTERDVVLAQIQDLVQVSEFTGSVSSLTPPSG